MPESREHQIIPRRKLSRRRKAEVDLCYNIEKAQVGIRGATSPKSEACRCDNSNEAKAHAQVNNCGARESRTPNNARAEVERKVEGGSRFMLQYRKSTGGHQGCYKSKK